jgi:transcriptional regulator with XRE-family HTH domain
MELAMDTLNTIDELCATQGLTPKDIAERAGLEQQRVQAIVAGRWTPSPQERDRVAAVFGLTRDQIAWGHKAAVDHIYGHGPQFGRSP